jgi:peptidoglycan/xylan/chitin deacetylase (PgdA/CDA1 family)
MFYLIKVPGWIKKLYPACTWEIDTTEKTIYLSFDDGPHIEATPFVLGELKKYNAKATFFCIGKNVTAHPAIYKNIMEEGHAVGNHTYNHLNGWKTDNDIYLKNITKAADIIESNLFRPPYGRITFKQVKALGKKTIDLKIVMWTVLSGDFDPGLSNEKCLSNITENAGSGSIIVLHDSEKALKKLQFVLPKMLAHFTSLGYRFDKIVLP